MLRTTSGEGGLGSRHPNAAAHVDGTRADGTQAAPAAERVDSIDMPQGTAADTSTGTGMAIDAKSDGSFITADGRVCLGLGCVQQTSAAW